MPLSAAINPNDVNCLQFLLPDYLELVDWTGRAIIQGKSGSIEAGVPPILDRLQIDEDAWKQALKACRLDEHRQAIGSVVKLKDYCKSLNKRWTIGTGCSLLMYRAPT